MLLNKKDKEYKHALALRKELYELRKKIISIEPIKLPVPIQSGYVRGLELTDEAKHRSDYQTILQVFNKVGHVKVYHYDKSFNVKSGKHNRSKSQKHAYMRSLTDPYFYLFEGRFNIFGLIKNYKFHEIPEYIFENNRRYTKESFKKEIDDIQKFRKYLDYHGTMYTCNCKQEQFSLLNIKKNFRPHYSFKLKWLIRETTKPHFLTHYTPVDNELESRVNEIESEMKSKNYWSLLTKRDSWTRLSKQRWATDKYKNKFDGSVDLDTLD